LKKLFILLVTAFIASQLFAGLAFAGELYARTVKNLSGSYDPETNSITLKWETIVTSRKDLNTDTITISKGTSDYDLKKIGSVNVNSVVRVDDLPPGELYDKTHEITFTDTNVELDKEYKYVVSCGSVSHKWQEIYVVTRSQLEEKSGEETAADRREKYEQNADWPEKLGGSILLAIPNYIVSVIGLDDPLELIYQVEVDDPGFKFSRPQIVIEDKGGEDKGGSNNDVYLHTFTKDEFGALAQFYDRLNEFVPVSLVVVIVLLGAGFLFVSVSPNTRLTAKDYIIGILIGLGILKFGIYLIAIFFDLNYMLVKFFHWIVGKQLSASFLDTLIDLESNAIGSAIITFLAIFSIGIINWQYTLRKVVLALLIGLIPIVAVISIAPSKRSAIDYWLREFIAQVFLQSSHAAALTLIILLIHANTGFWVSLVGIMSLPAIASIVRRVVGAESFGTGIASGIGTALGLGSLFAISKMLKPNGRVAKPPLDNAGGGLVETAGSATGASGGFMGNMIRTGFRTAAGLTAGVAGGLITGAATGNPGFGLVTGIAAGTAVGGGIVDTAQSVIDNFRKSPAERMESHGIIDPAQLDDPNQAFEYGKKLFGGGAIGTVAGLGMAAGKKVQSLMGHADPGIARQVKSAVDQNTANLSRARQELANYKPVYDEARARLTYAKSMFSPDSSYMQDLKQQARTLETKLHEAEQRYADAYDEWQNNWEDKITSPSSMTPAAVAALQRVQQAQEESAGLRNQLQEVQERITLGKQEYQDAQANFQSVEAEYAQRQEAVSYFQQNLTRAGIKQEFEKLKAQKLETRGDIDSSWR
jgi:predicted  nucleic acid-binding Zn-ribbon protein